MFSAGTSESFLVHEDESVAHGLLRLIDVVAPLLQAGHLQWHIKVFLALRLNDADFVVADLHKEVWVIVGNCPRRR